MAIETALLGCFDLAAHIRAAGRVVTNYDDHKAWAATILLRQCIYFAFHRILEGLRDLFTVDYHIFSSLCSRYWFAALTKVVRYAHVRFSHFRTRGATFALAIYVARGDHF